MKKSTFKFYILILAAIDIFPQQSDFPILTGPYLGQKTPGVKPEVFAKDITTDDNGGFVFSKNSDEAVFFSITNKGKSVIRYIRLLNGYWSNPQIIFQLNSENNVHPFLSGDGTKLIFGSDRRINQNEKVIYYNLWMSEKVNGNWSEPRPLPSLINTGYENCGSFSGDSTLYFRRVSQNTLGDIFQSNYTNGEFSIPIKLPADINTIYDESHPAISPDGDYLIFSSKRPGGFNKGKDELWVSFKKENDEWSKAVNMGKQINNGSNTSCATISPDGKFIFFIRIENGKGISYWVSSKIIDEFRPKE